MESHDPNTANQPRRVDPSPGDVLIEEAQPDYAHVPTNYGKTTGLKLLIVIVLLAIALIVGFALVQRTKNHATASLDNQTSLDEHSPLVVDVVGAKYAPTTQPLTLPGETRGWYESTIYARVSGYVAKWCVNIGDKVTAGEVLATIETPELDAQLMAARAKLNAADAEVNVEQANTAFAKSSYDRWRESPKGVVSDQEREEKKAEFNTSVAKLNAAQAQVKLNQAEVDSLTALTKFKQVTAPFDGVITGRRIDIGDLVTAGSTASTTSLYSISQSDKIRVFVDVPQRVAGDIKVGMPVVTVDGEHPDHKLDGVVARTAEAIDPQSRTLRVEVDVNNSNMELVPGMYLDVSFELVHKPLLQVPASALLFRSSGSEVAVVDPNGTLHFHRVVIANDQGDFVEVSSGLSADDKIALNISSQVNDGDIVEAVDLDKAAKKTGPAGPSPVAASVPLR